MEIFDNALFLSDLYVKSRTNFSEPVLMYEGSHLRFNAAFRKHLSSLKSNYITFFVKDSIPYLSISSKRIHKTSKWITKQSVPTTGKVAFVNAYLQTGTDEDYLRSIRYFKLVEVEKEDGCIVFAIIPSMSTLKLS